jgi:hypothetical protein
MKDAVKHRFLLLWLCSAAFVTGVRFFHAMPMSLDLALQIQAAQNLIAGNGLSIYEHTASDLAAPATLIPLTIFGSGYSFYTASVLALGGSEGIASRLLPAAATLLGWWGWGALAYCFFRQKMNHEVMWKWAGFLIALSTPILFTIGWGGTDIFLWAAVPWVLRWVLEAAKQDAGGARFDLMAGVLCGLAILMRYSSAFLATYAVFLIAWQSRLRLPALIRRGFYFSLGFLPFFAVQLYINLFLTRGPASPGGLSFKFGSVAALQRALEGFPLLRTANFPWAFWFPGFALRLLFPDVSNTLPWQLALVLAASVFLAVTIRTYRVDLQRAAQDSRVTAIGLLVAFPLLLWVCMMLGSYDYVGNKRYYEPLLPLSIFVIYSVASLRSNGKEASLTRIIQKLGAIYVVCYVALSLAYIALFFVPGERGAIERDRLFASLPAPWPSLGFGHEFSPARRFVVARLREDPNTVLLVSSKTAWFFGDAALDRSRIHELSCGDYLRATYVAGPARLVFLTFDEGKPQDLWTGAELVGELQSRNADCFERLPGLSLLQRFPDERLKVLESLIPSGTRVFLRP